MSRLDEAQRRQDELERYLSAPIPTPQPADMGCAQSGWKGHSFEMPGVTPGVCAYCNLTRVEIEAAKRQTEAA